MKNKLFALLLALVMISAYACDPKSNNNSAESADGTTEQDSVSFQEQSVDSASVETDTTNQ
jgi:hypothetical protein